MSLRYIPELDGIRAIAALVVVAFHVRLPGFYGGFLGVDVFFVLSGYLTASIALSGRFGFAAFMIRRLRRLWPLLLTVCGAVAVYHALTGVFRLGDVWPAAVFLGNVPPILNGAQGLLVHTWTLANEMQFYALIAVLGLSCSAPVFRLVCICLFLATTFTRFYYAYLGAWDLGFYSPIARSSGLFAGAIVATIPMSRLWVRHGFYRLCAAAVGFAFMFAGFQTTAALLVWILIVEMATAGLIVTLVAGAGTFGAVLRGPYMRHLGQLSFGIYLWHYPIALAVRDSLLPPVAFVVTLCFSVILATLTHRFVEQPFRISGPSRIATIS